MRAPEAIRNAVPTMQPKMILRDLAVLAVTSALWWADARLHGEAGVVSAVVGVSAGVLAGVFGYYLHEWGHLAGALLGGGRVRFPDRLSAPLLFDFDVERSSRRQFLAMSLGGYAGSALGLGILSAVLPFDRLSGWVALAAIALGTMATIVLEAPTTYRVARGAEPPRALIEVAPADPGEATPR